MTAVKDSGGSAAKEGREKAAGVMAAQRGGGGGGAQRRKQKRDSQLVVAAVHKGEGGELVQVVWQIGQRIPAVVAWMEGGRGLGRQCQLFSGQRRRRASSGRTDARARLETSSLVRSTTSHQLVL